ncbi:head decoration protein [Serratia sp. MF2]|uniref:head decoration protein n=1 Tax=Serratia sp. MF1(2023) TaxID=3059171 RepID=UPI0027E6883C|nr:head decoration protein [Serratia sp. MF1(2023)]MDQ7104201.1 head decoration protein [Serratia sp. MF1(2023)]
MTTQIGQFKFVNIFAGEMYRSTKSVTLAAGRIYPAGSVLALNSAGESTLVDSGAEGSLSIPDSVLADEVDATESTAVGVGYATGEFNRTALTFGGSDTWETHASTARGVGLFFLPVSQLPE